MIQDGVRAEELHRTPFSDNPIISGVAYMVGYNCRQDTSSKSTQSRGYPSVSSIDQVPRRAKEAEYLTELFGPCLFLAAIQENIQVEHWTRLVLECNLHKNEADTHTQPATPPEAI